MKAVILFGLLLLSMQQALAFEAVKYVRRVLNVDKNTSFFLNIDFGDITVCQWQQDSVVVEATFGIEGVEEWEIPSFKNQLDLQFEQWEGVVKGSCVFSDHLTDTNRIRVKMMIYVPEYLSLEIINRHGIIRVPHYVAYRDLVLSAVYGHIAIDTLHSNSEVEVKLNVSYGGLKIQSCDRVFVRSAYSDIQVLEAKQLNVKAEKSRFQTGQVNVMTIEGESNYHDVKGEKFAAP